MTPLFVTETNTEPPWLDCTWAAGLMLAQKASDNTIPGTRDEREALRRASNDRVGGSNLDDLSLAFLVRYGWRTARWDGTLESARIRLAMGSGAVWQGLYSRLPKHLQRWDTRFAAKGAKSGHAAYIEDYRPSDGTVLWMDPLARTGPGQEPWQGERWDWDDIAAACFGPSFLMVLRGGQFAPAPPPAPDPDPTIEGEDEMFNIAPATTHRDAVLKAGAVLYRDSKLTRRYSRVDKETPLGFIGSGRAFHAVINSGNTNYVRRDDVARIVNNERSFT